MEHIHRWERNGEKWSKDGFDSLQNGITKVQTDVPYAIGEYAGVHIIISINIGIVAVIVSQSWSTLITLKNGQINET